MRNEAIAAGVPTKVYLDLAFHLRKNGDLRSPDQVVALAIKAWLASRAGKLSGQGYQWKDLFLPDGTDLRMRYRGVWHYASVDGDRVMYGGEPVSPREWGLMVTGNVRNPWRDVWIRRSISDAWTRASALREAPSAREVAAPGADRRRTARRATD
jgi:hypothetical protein